MALYKAVLRSRFTDGSENRNIFYATSSDPEGDIPLAFQGYVARFINAVRAILTSTLHFYGVDIYKYIANEVWELLEEAGLDITGDRTDSDSLPHQIAGVLIGATQNGRSKGKKFVPGVVESASIGGVLTAGALSTLAGCLAAWLTDYVESMNDAVIHPVLHRKGKTDLEFTGGKTDIVTGTQRRRKQGVGI